MPPLKFIAIALSAAVAVTIFASPFRVGDFLYLGLWYYAATPIVVIAYAAYLLPTPFFVLGSVSGLAITLVPFWVFQTMSARPEGLLGLVHLLSFPFVLAGMWLASRAMLKFNTNDSLVALAAGAVGALGGELFGELILCGLRLVCGPVSFWLFT